MLELVCIETCVFMQGVFDHRMKTWQKWQDSQLLLQRKREAEAKLQFTNKPDKLQQAKDEIKEVRHRDGQRDRRTEGQRDRQMEGGRNINLNRL